MSWPKKDEAYRPYKEPKGEGNGRTYLLICVDSRTPNGDYEALGEMLIDNNPNKPCLATTSVSPAYLAQCQRVAWEDLPPAWQEAFIGYLPDSNPNNHRGLHRMQPKEV